MIKVKSFVSIGLLVVMALVFSFEFQAKEVSAYSYSDALSISFSGKWSNDYYLTELNDEHWYKIYVPEDGKVQIKLMHFMWNIYTALYNEMYNEDLSKKISSGSYYKGDEFSPEVDLSEIVLSAGTYYLKITGDRGKYLLDFNPLNKTNCNHEYATKTVFSTYLNRGYDLHKCEKCGKSYKDHYTAKIKLGQGYISMYSHSGKGKIHLQWYLVSDASKTIKGRTKSKKTIKNISRRKKYYVQVRAYKKLDAKTVYGKWSSKRSLRTK